MVTILLAVLLVPYLSAGIMVGRTVAGHIAWSESRRYEQAEPDRSDWTTGCAMGLLAGAGWPLAPVMWLAYHYVALLMRKAPRIGAERDRFSEQLVRQLERDTDLDL